MLYMYAFGAELVRCNNRNNRQSAKLPRAVAAELWGQLLPVMFAAADQADQDFINSEGSKVNTRADQESEPKERTWNAWLTFATLDSPDIAADFPGVTRDSWSMAWSLLQEFPDKSTLVSYDADEGGWPLLIDAFVEWWT
jgi:hypothetical protein